MSSSLKEAIFVFDTGIAGLQDSDARYKRFYGSDSEALLQIYRNCSLIKLY